MGFTFCSSPETHATHPLREPAVETRSPRSGSGENVFVDAAGPSESLARGFSKIPESKNRPMTFPRFFMTPPPANNLTTGPQNSAKRYSGHLGR